MLLFCERVFDRVLTDSIEDFSDPKYWSLLGGASSCLVQALITQVSKNGIKMTVSIDASHDGLDWTNIAQKASFALSDTSQSIYTESFDLASAWRGPLLRLRFALDQVATARVQIHIAGRARRAIHLTPREAIESRPRPPPSKGVRAHLERMPQRNPGIRLWSAVARTRPIDPRWLRESTAWAAPTPSEREPVPAGQVECNRGCECAVKPECGCGERKPERYARAIQGATHDLAPGKTVSPPLITGIAPQRIVPIGGEKCIGLDTTGLRCPDFQEFRSAAWWNCFETARRDANAMWPPMDPESPWMDPRSGAPWVRYRVDEPGVVEWEVEVEVDPDGTLSEASEIARLPAWCEVQRGRIVSALVAYASQRTDVPSGARPSVLTPTPATWATFVSEMEAGLWGPWYQVFMRSLQRCGDVVNNDDMSAYLWPFFYCSTTREYPDLIFGGGRYPGSLGDCDERPLFSGRDALRSGLKWLGAADFPPGVWAESSTRCVTLEGGLVPPPDTFEAVPDAAWEEERAAALLRVRLDPYLAFLFREELYPALRGALGVIDRTGLTSSQARMVRCWLALPPTETDASVTRMVIQFLQRLVDQIRVLVSSINERVFLIPYFAGDERARTAWFRMLPLTDSEQRELDLATGPDRDPRARGYTLRGRAIALVHWGIASSAAGPFGFAAERGINVAEAYDIIARYLFIHEAIHYTFGSDSLHLVNPFFPNGEVDVAAWTAIVENLSGIDGWTEEAARLTLRFGCPGYA